MLHNKVHIGVSPAHPAQVARRIAALRMGKKSLISIVLILLAAGPALADLVAPFEPSTVLTALSSQIAVTCSARVETSLPTTAIYLRVGQGTAAWLHHSPATATGLAPGVVSTPAARFAHGGNAAGSSADVVELPPPPSGGALTLSGLLTLGAMQAARSVRHAQIASFLRIGSLPDWYDADAGQIGHSVPFEFQVSLQPLPATVSRITPEPERADAGDVQPDADGRIRSPQHSLLSITSRGPPLF